MNPTPTIKSKIIEAELLEGEMPMADAPSVFISDSKTCIPQHFLNYHHDRASVESLVADMSFDDNYLIFVDQDLSGVFIQIGIIGRDNYRTEHEKKIVYGRKWRVEASLPTSEIIQTAFLAIKTAREHEVRELLLLKTTQGVATPFNNHHDLPMMADNSADFMHQVQQQTIEQISESLADVLNSVAYDKAKFKLMDIQKRASGSYLIDIQVLAFFNGRIPELVNTTLTLLVDSLCCNIVLHELMTQLLLLSNRYVEEHFKFKGFARFSRQVSINSIAQTSIRMRSGAQTIASDSFKEVYKQNNYETDNKRVPRIYRGALGYAIQSRLEELQPLLGILPTWGDEINQ